MIKFLLRNTLRNIIAQLRFSLINCIGLVIGISIFVLIMSWVSYELSFDNFNQDKESIYRVSTTSGAETPNAMAVALESELPEVQIASRYQNAPALTFKVGDEVFYENNVALADPSLFKILNYRFSVGNADDALSKPYNIVLTQRMAEKYFKDTNPIGKTILIDNHLPATVTGIMENLPSNSHLQFDCLIPFIVMKELGFDMDSWYNWNPNTYVKLQENANKVDVEAKVQALVDNHRRNNRETFVLQPLRDIHFNTKLDFDKAVSINPTYIYILSIGSLLILIISIINYVNLNLSLYNKRINEIGVKRTLGASKSNVIKQVFVDTFVVVLISFLVSFLIISAVSPIYDDFLGGEINYHLFSLQSLIGFAALVILITVLSAIYPALLMTSYKLINILNKKRPVNRQGFSFREVSVVVQFALSVLLIVGAIGISKQLNYMKNEDLGFDSENIVSIPMSSNSETKYRSFSNELCKNVNIESVSFINHSILGFNSTNGSLHWDGQLPDEKIWVGTNSVDYNYLDLMNVEFADGRNFSKDLISNRQNTVIVNEALVKRIRYENPIGKNVKFNGKDLEIIGVIKDAHFQSLHKVVEPQIYKYIDFKRDLDYSSVVVIKVKNQVGGSFSMASLFKDINATWNQIYPEYPFDYSFLDQAIENQYKTEQKLTFLMYIFSGLSIVLSSLGLFALSLLVVQYRTKEIGVRKVTGAKVSEILVLLNRDFLKWVTIAFVIASPVAWYIIDKWLENFAYKTNLSWWIFALAGIMTLGIALLTVSFQSWKAASRNPIESLRYE